MVLMYKERKPWKKLGLNKKEFKKFYKEAVKRGVKDPAAVAASRAYRAKAKRKK